MPKGKLRIETTKAEQFKSSAVLNEIRVDNETQIGDQTIFEIFYRSVQNLFDTATMLPYIQVSKKTTTKEN